MYEGHYIDIRSFFMQFSPSYIFKPQEITFFYGVFLLFNVVLSMQMIKWQTKAKQC